MTIRRFTAELLAAQADGHLILCSADPWHGYPVRHAPRRTGDPEPWLLQDVTAHGAPVRVSGRDCHSVPGRQGGPLQRAEEATPGCTCAWVRNLRLRAWERMTRKADCPEHGRHDHWAQGCPADPDGNGAWVLWLCPPALCGRYEEGEVLTARE